MDGNLVRAVVDVEREIIGVNGELHSDEEELLIKKESQPKNLWGINLYPKIGDENWIEFNSVNKSKISFWQSSQRSG